LCEQRGGLYLLIDDADRAQVLGSLSRQVAAGAATLARPYRQWDDLFEHLGTLDVPFCVLDEFQWVIAGDPQAVTRLQGHWDAWIQERGPSIVLCGSSVGMMQRITQGRRGPLFGRLTADLRVRPFTYGAVRLLYPDADEAERVRRYAVFGGTPHYHRFSVARRLEDAVKASFLDEAAPFQEEPQSLLHLELKAPTRYNSILYEIGHGTRALRDLETKVGVKRGGLSPYLEVLRDDLDLVRMEDPVCGKKKAAHYVFSDPFFSFYYRFIFGARPALEIGRLDAVWERIEEELDAHVGRVFEQVVHQTLLAANGQDIDGVPIRFDEIGRWWNRIGDELDVVARGPDELLVGEVTWSIRPAGRELLADAQRKAELIEHRSGLPVRPIVAARAGLTLEAERDARDAHAIVLDLDGIARIHERLASA